MTGEPEGEPEPEELPVRLIVAAYLMALLCAVVPLIVLGAGFAGVVVFNRGKRSAGAGVIAVAVLSAAIGIALRT